MASDATGRMRESQCCHVKVEDLLTTPASSSYHFPKAGNACDKCEFDVKPTATSLQQMDHNNFPLAANLDAETGHPPSLTTVSPLCASAEVCSGKTRCVVYLLDLWFLMKKSFSLSLKVFSFT